MKKNTVPAAFLLGVLAFAPLSAFAETEASRETSATVKNTQTAEDRVETRVGKLKKYLKGPNNEITGIVLNDGTTAQLPPDMAKKIYKLTQPGSMLMVTGVADNDKFLARSVSVNSIQYNVPADFKAN
jgi:hypothetical protein